MKKRRMIIAIACVLLAAAIGITAYAAVSAKNRTREMQKYDPFIATPRLSIIV